MRTSNWRLFRKKPTPIAHSHQSVVTALETIMVTHRRVEGDTCGTCTSLDLVDPIPYPCLTLSVAARALAHFKKGTHNAA